MSDIIKNGFDTMIAAFKEFQGSGLVLVIFLLGMLYIAYSSKNRLIKDAFVKYPLYVLIVFFCPVWYVYAYYSQDSEILYRIMWLLPLGVLICYVFTEIICRLSNRARPAFLAACVLVIVISGEYTYANEYFSLSENVYHVPDAVVEICDEIKVEGREIRAAFPDELINYVRQYSPYICLPYGRETFMGLGALEDPLQAALNADIIDTEEAVYWLRYDNCPYLIVDSSKNFTESLSKYEFIYVTSVENYDIYLDNQAYIGIDFINYR